MSVVNINDLKARFATRDRPSQKDYVDLIDTLIMGNTGSLPTGPAGGDLVGTYPNPAVASTSDDGLDAARPITGDNIKNGSLTLNKLSTGGASTGAVPMNTISGVVWQIPGTETPGGPVIPTSVSGAVGTYVSNLIDIPDEGQGFGGTAIVNAAGFGASPPQHVQVCLVVMQDIQSANYVVGDEIPIDHARIFANPELPAVTCCNYPGEDGLSRTFLIKVLFGADGSGFALVNKTALAQSTQFTGALVPLANVADVKAKLKLRIYTTRFEAGVGFGSISSHQPASLALPADGGLLTFTHNFGALPSFQPRVWLACASNDAATGHVVGDTIPIFQAIDAAANYTPAFGITMNNTQVLVRREAATIHVPKKADGVLTAILTEANWRIGCESHRAVNVPTHIFPQTMFHTIGTGAGIGYGDKLYYFNRNRDTTKHHLNMINLTNNNVTAFTQTNRNSAVFSQHPTLWRSAAGVDYMIWSDGWGVSRLRLDNHDYKVIIKQPTTTILGTQVLNGSWHCRVLLDLSEGASNDLVRPQVMLFGRSYLNDTNARIEKMEIRKMTWDGSMDDYSYVADAGSLNWLTIIGASTSNPLRDIFVNTHTANTVDVRVFQYNPIKKRFYLGTNTSGHLYILKLDAAETPLTWMVFSGSTVTVDPTKLTMEKIIMLPAGGHEWKSTDGERHVIEWDTVSGAERSIVLNVFGDPSMGGSLTRIPWVE